MRTRIRKTMTPSTARWATSLPQLAPISEIVMSSDGTPEACDSSSASWSVSSVDISSTWMRIELPAVVTIGDSASGRPESWVTSRSRSAVSCEMSEAGTEYCVPPVNSMPKFRPRSTIAAIAAITNTLVIAYQIGRRWMKSIDFRPL